MSRRYRFAGSVGFGLERVGLGALRHPRVALAALALALAFAVYGLFHLSVDRNLRDMFRGESEAYRTYAEIAGQYFDLEDQILVLVSGDGLRAPEVLVRLQTLHLDLLLLPEVGSVYSIFSLRGPPDPEGVTHPILADASVGLDDETLRRLRAHPILGSGLIAADGKTTLISIAAAAERPPAESLARLAGAVGEIVREAFAGTDVTATVTGLAAIRGEIVRLLQRDQLVLNGAGIVVGFLLSLVFFRSWVASLMTAVPAMVAGLILLGCTAAIGIEVTIISNVVPVLVMVLGYADGMHLTAAWRRQREKGSSAEHAEKIALMQAAAPCMLTALAMAIAFLSMTISDVRIVRDFGWLGAIGTIVGTWTVLVAHALAGRYLGRLWRPEGRPSTPLAWLAAPVGGLTAFVIRFRWPVIAASIPLTIVCSILFLSVPPEHSVRETLPTGTASIRALEQIDAEHGGAFPVQIVVPVPPDALADPATVAAVRAVHEAAVSVAGVRSALSIWSLAEWLGEAATEDDVAALLGALPPETFARFAGAPGALVTVNIPELPTHDTLRIIDDIEAAVTAVAPDAIVTGATVVAAREGAATIATLNASLGLAVFGGLLLIAIALRSPIMGLVALVPNLLPDMVTGSLLYFLGDGMQLTALVGLTIAFGIAIDDTVHYLTVVRRFRHIGDLKTRLIAAAREVGPVLVATTLIIVIGMCMTLTSGLSSVALFGMIVVTSLIMAMFGDILLLPAIIAGPAAAWFRGRPAKPAAAKRSVSGQSAAARDGGGSAGE